MTIDLTFENVHSVLIRRRMRRSDSTPLYVRRFTLYVRTFILMTHFAKVSTKFGNKTTIQLTSENFLSTSIFPRMYRSASKSKQMCRFILRTHFAATTLLLNLLYKTTIDLTCENSHFLLIRRRMRRLALTSAYRCADSSRWHFSKVGLLQGGEDS